MQGIGDWRRGFGMRNLAQLGTLWVQGYPRD